jgi:hypothetical protein
MSRVPYALAPDVSAQLPWFTLTATSKPSASQVDDMLLGVSDELDARLKRNGYALPIPTGATQSQGVLNQWAAIGGAMETALALPQGTDGKHFAALERRWNAILKGIDDGSEGLPDDGLKTTTSGVARHARSGDCATSYFTRDEDL